VYLPVSCGYELIHERPAVFYQWEKGGAMLRRMGICLVLLALVLLPMSCTKLPQWEGEQGNIAIEKLPQVDSIPLQWGKLVSVTNLGAVAHELELWFEDDKGTLRMVVYDVRANRLYQNCRLIPRT
jgi:hypothetical protein